MISIEEYQDMILRLEEVIGNQQQTIDQLEQELRGEN